jgi:hypothetical protein
MADRPARAADCPLKPTEPPIANPEKRTVRGEHADYPPGTRGLSVRYTRTVRNLAQKNLKSPRIENGGEQEHEEHTTNSALADRPPAPRGPSAPCGQNRKQLDPESQHLQSITGSPKL